MALTMQRSKVTGLVKTNSDRQLDEAIRDIADLYDSANNGGADGYSYLEVPVSSSQILSMGTSAVELLPAPGVNMYYDAIVVLEFTYNSIKYTMPVSDDIAVVFESTYQGSLVRRFIDGFDSSDTVATCYPASSSVEQANTSGGVFISSYAQKKNDRLILTLFNGGNPTNGNGTILAKVWYKVKTFGTEL